MNKRELAEEMIADENPDALFMDGMDEAIVGIASQYPSPPLVVYDREAIVGLLVADGMDDEDAREFAAFNIEGAYVGHGTPLILIRLEEPD